MTGLVLTFSIGICASAWGGQSPPPSLPDPSTGQINGKVAITVVPTTLGKQEILPPWGFTAHLTGYDDPGRDLEIPCGLWAQPPRGRYRVWIEGNWQISPFSRVIRFSPIPFRGGGMIFHAPTGEAGRVALPPSLDRRSDLVLRLLHAGPHAEEGYARWEMSRRKPVREVGEGLLMPVGMTIGALWDERSQSYVAISRPFRVKARQDVIVPLEWPSLQDTHLVAQIQRATLAKDVVDGNMKIVLRRQKVDLLPDLQVSLTDRVYAVWYGLAPGPGTLHAEAKDASLQPQQLNLMTGRIERLFKAMTPRPANSSTE